MRGPSTRFTMKREATKVVKSNNKLDKEVNKREVKRSEQGAPVLPYWGHDSLTQWGVGCKSTTTGDDATGTALRSPTCRVPHDYREGCLC